MSKKNTAAKICNPKCKYFPNQPSEVTDERVDADGVKHRSSVWICVFSGDRITRWGACGNYKPKLTKLPKI